MMSLRKFVFFIIIVLSSSFSLISSAQDNFGSEKELKNKAAKYFNSEDYSTCLPLYSQLLSLYPKDPEMNYRYGVCILMAGKEKEKSIAYLSTASKSPEIDKEVYFYLGKALHLNYRFDEAVANYTLYKSKASAKNLAKFDVDRQIDMCKNGKSLLQSITDISVIQKNQFPMSDYFRAYDLGKSGIKVLVKPEDLKSIVDKKRNETSVIVVNPGNPYIYFSSYGDEDKGHKEIYRIAKNDNFSWPKAQNVGNAINSSFDDDYPFPSSDGKTLFFASKGHNSMGGFDIFRSVYDSTKGFFSAPENLDFAINTPDDDILFISDPKIDFAYFASKRSSDANNISVFKIKKERLPGKFVLVKGNFFANNPQTHTPTKITIKTSDNTKLVSAINTNPKTGDFQLMLRQGSTYTYTVETSGFLTQNQKVTIPENTKLIPLLQLVNYSKINDKEILTISSKYDESSSAEATLQASIQLLKDMANLEVNAIASSSSASKESNAIANNKSNQAEKPKNKEYPNITVEHQKILRTENDEYKRLKNETDIVKKETDDLASIAKEKSDSAAYFDSESQRKKSGSLKKKAEIYALQAEEMQTQFKEAETRYQEKKAKSDKQEKYLAALESNAEKGNNEGIASLSSDKKNFNPQASNTPSTDPKLSKIEDLNTQIENLNKDLKTLSDPKQKEMVQKQLAQLIEERNQAKVDAGITVAKSDTPSNTTPNQNIGIVNNTPENKNESVANNNNSVLKDTNDTKANNVNSNSTIKASEKSVDSNQTISATKNGISEEQINKANDIKKRATQAKDPVQRAKLNEQANKIYIEENTKGLSFKNDEIEVKQTEIVNSEKLLIGSNVSAQINEENKSLLADIATLKVQAETEKNSTEKVKKLERANTLQLKVLENQTRILVEVKNISEANKLAIEANEKKAKELESKAEEISKPLATIETSKQKDLSTAKDLRDYAAGLKSKSKRTDAENAAKDYENSAAKKQARIDSISNAANEFKKQAEETRNPQIAQAKIEEENKKQAALAQEKASVEAENKRKKEEELAKANSSINNTNSNTNSANSPVKQESNSNNSNVVISSELSTKTNAGTPLVGNSAIYVKNKLDEDALSKEVEQNKTEIEQLISSGNNKINSIVDLLETAQESGDKKLRKKAEIESVLLDLDGRKDLAKADSLKNILAVKTNTLAQKKTINQDFINKLSAAEAEKVKAEYVLIVSPKSNNVAEKNNEIESNNNAKSETTNGTDNSTTSINTATKESSASENKSELVQNKTNATEQNATTNNNVEPTVSKTEKNSEKSISNKVTSSTSNPDSNISNPTNPSISKSESTNSNSTNSSSTLINTNAINQTDLSTAAKNSNVENKTENTTNSELQVKSAQTTTSSFNNTAVSVAKETKPSYLKYKNYKPGDKIKGVSFSAEESKEIVLSEKFNTYYNLRQEGDSVNYIYTKYLTKAQQSGDTANMLGLQAAELSELADGSKGEQKIKLKNQAKQKEDSAALYLKIADASYATAKKLAKEIKAKDDKSIDYVNKLDNRDASDFTLIYERIGKTEFTDQNNEIKDLQDKLLSLNPEKKKIAEEKEKAEIAAQEKAKELTVANEVKVEKAIPANQENKENNRTLPVQEKTIPTETNKELLVSKNETNTINKSIPADNFTSNNANTTVIAYDAAVPKGIIFKVQIGAFKRKVAENAFGNIQPIFGENSATGMIRYFAGEFSQFEPANEARKQIASGVYTDCFVVAYCNGRKIPVTRARALLASGRDCDGGELNQSEVIAANVANNPEIAEILKEQKNLKSFNQLLYTVQVGVYRTLVNSKTLNGLSPLYYDTLRNRNIRYSVGIYNNRAEANEAKNYCVNAGVRDAFVIPFFNKRRISLEQAAEIERTQGSAALVSGALVNQKAFIKEANSITENLNATSPVDVSNVSSSEVYIKVQIGVFRKDVPVETLNLFLQLAPKGIDVSKSDDGLTTYSIGKFKNTEEANKLREEAQKLGLNDAFLVGYAKDKKITVDKAIELIKR
jgi:hypothetical protein